MKMRIMVAAVMLLPSLAGAAHWVPLGDTPEARIELDKDSVQPFDGGTRASLRFLYHRTQPAQTISRGKPFDSTTNQYYLVCSSLKYQVLELAVFYGQEQVGLFKTALNPDDMDDVRLGTGVMFLAKRVCPAR